MKWIAFHVFFHDPGDRFLTACVSPLVATLTADALIRRFFFVRYAEGGMHYRLRFELCQTDEPGVRSRIERTLEAFLTRSPSRYTVPEDALRELNRRLEQTEEVLNPLPPQPNNSFVEQPYVPEVDRYGGWERLQVSEFHFEFSSALALAIAARAASEPERRAYSLKLCAAVQFMLSIAKGFGCSDAQIRELYGAHHRMLHHRYAALPHDTCEARAVARQRRVQDLVAAMRARDTEAYRHSVRLREELLAVSPETETVAQRAQLYSRLLMSYSHMFLNRIGLYLDEEASLSWILSQTT